MDGAVPPAPISSSPSPMVAAYAAACAAAPGHLVLYRVGEFYEVLHEGAAIVSRLLGIQLTRRRQKDAPDIPMCGVPAGTADAAVARLLKAGCKVALSEQPAEPGGERPLRRLTPGTSVDADVLAATAPNNLAVAYAEAHSVAFAWIDLSTGEGGTCMASLDGCGAALARIMPSEVLVLRWPEGSEALALALRGSGVAFSDLPGDGLVANEADAVLAEAHGPGVREVLRGFSPPELTAYAALLSHVRGVIGPLPAGLPPPRRAAVGDTMEIDGPTLRGLEVLTSVSGRDGSLLAVVDRTVTLFATHFHELADAADAMPHAACMAMEAAPGRHGEVFTYRIGPGRAGRSHGLKVAALAGMPASVLARATVLLAEYTGEAPALTAHGASG